MFKEAYPDFIGNDSLEEIRDKMTIGIVQAMKDIARLDARQEYLDGEKSGVKKTAKRMLADGLDVATVIKYTNLEKKIVLEMQRKINAKIKNGN